MPRRKSHHVGTRGHFKRSSKRENAGGWKSQNDQQLGNQPYCWPCTHVTKINLHYLLHQAIKRAIQEKQTCLKKHENGEAHDNNADQDIFFRRGPRRRYTKITPTLIDHMDQAEFQSQLLNCDVDTEYVYHVHPTKLKVLRTVRIQARYSWLLATSETHPTLKKETGLTRALRSAPSFYNDQPYYDFIEFEISEADSTGVVETRFGQLRLIFEQP